MRVDELQTPEAVFTFIEDEQKTDPSWAPLRHYQTKPAEVKESAKKKDAEDVIEEEDEIEVNNDK